MKACSRRCSAIRRSGRTSPSMSGSTGTMWISSPPSGRTPTARITASIAVADSWTKTNEKHIAFVQAGNSLAETRIVKLWRNQKGLDFPSFYLELTVINALAGRHGALSDNLWSHVFPYLRDSFAGARVVDPANTNN